MTSTTVIRALHEKSELVERPELDFFKAPYTDASIKHTVYETFSTVGPIRNDEKEDFTINVPPDPLNYIDLSRCYMELVLQPESPVDTDLTKQILRDVPPTGATPAEIAAMPRIPAWNIVNNIGASIFSLVSVYLNDHNIFHSPYYAYQAILTKLLNVTTNNLESVQRLAYFTLEEQTEWENWNFDDNPGIQHRSNIISRVQQKDRQFKVYDRIYIPLTYAYKLLPNNINIRLELTQAPAAFTIIATPTRTGRPVEDWTQTQRPQIRLRVVTLKWHVCKVRPYEHILQSNNAKLLREPAVFFFPKRDMRIFLIAPSEQSFHQLIYTGRKPHSLSIIMVKDEHAMGTYYSNPFNFDHTNIKTCTLSINNLYPVPPLNFSHGTNPNWEAGYRSLLEYTGHNAEYGEGPLISPEKYRKGNFIIHYSLSNNLSADTLLESAEVANIYLTLEFLDRPHDIVTRVMILFRIDDYIECVGADRRMLPSFAVAQ